MLTATRYTVLLVCCPFPFQVSTVAHTRESAIAKAKYQAKLCGLKTGKVIEITEDATVEIKEIK